METNKEQPDLNERKGVAQLAKVGRLQAHHDLDPIDKFAQRFGLDPDRVYWKSSFFTVTKFLIKWKEEREYDERFNYIMHEIRSASK